MIYDKISYRRVKNLGNYESETVELSALVQPTENGIEVFRALKNEAALMLNITPFKHQNESKDDIPF